METNPQSGAPLPPFELAQIHRRLLHLSNQVEALQDLVQQTAISLNQETAQLALLVQHLTKTARREEPLADRLVEFTEQMSADHEQLIFLSRKLTELATQEQLVRLATLVATQTQVMELAERVRELSRVQQRAIDRDENRERQVGGVLDTLNAVLVGRHALQEEARTPSPETLDEVRSQARGDFAADFLPALDGLEAVLDEGRMLLARQRQEIAEWSQGHPDPRAAPSGLVNRLRSRLAGESEEGMALTPGSPESVAAAKLLSSWLKGLALVRDRFIALMAQEGIQPIAALRQRFDPGLHVAVQSEPRGDLPPDTVVREVRKGFRQGRRVLRYAEVVVARPPAAPPAVPPPREPPPTPFTHD